MAEGGVGHVADHDGVDDAHRHPAEFGEDERKSEREHGPDLLAYGHGLCWSPPLPLISAKVFETKELTLDLHCKLLISDTLFAKYSLQIR